MPAAVRITAGTGRSPKSRRVMGDCVFGAEIDSELQKLDSPSLFASSGQKFTYVRYDQPFEVSPCEAKRMTRGRTEMDNLELIPFLQRAGKEYAGKYVSVEHLYPRSRGS